MKTIPSVRKYFTATDALGAFAELLHTRLR